MQGQMRARGGGGSPSTSRPELPVPHKTFAFYKHAGKSQQNGACQERKLAFERLAVSANWSQT